MVHLGFLSKLWNGIKGFGSRAVGAVKTLVPKVVNVVKKVGGAVGNFVRGGGMDDVLDKADKTWRAVKPLLPEQAQQGGERVRRKVIDVSDKGRYLVGKYDQIYRPKGFIQPR